MPEILDPKKRRNRLTNMIYDEISFVDKGANQHAHVVLVKRDDEAVMAANRAARKNGSSSSGGRKADWYAADRAPTESGSGKGKKSERAMHWKEDKHPRNAKGSGSPRGGTFKKTSAQSKKKYGKGGTTKAKLDAKKKSGSKGGKSYSVKKGDTLWALAEKYYGDGTKWKLIAKANGVKDPRKLQIGTKLTIPGITDKKTAKKGKVTHRSPSASPGERKVMEPGGKVHWEKIKAKKKATASPPKKKTKAQIQQEKIAAAKVRLARAKRAAAAKKKLSINKRVTEVEKIAAQVMFETYTGRG